MGLTGVELLIAVEDRFGVALGEDEARALETVGDLQALLMAKLHLRTGEVGLASHVFSRLRRALMLAYDLPREQVTPETPLAALLPARGRRRGWRRLTRELRLQVPPLAPPRPLFRAIIGLGALAALGVVAAFVITEGTFWPAVVHSLFAALFGGLLVLLALFSLTAPFAHEVPARCATVREMVRTLVADNYHALRRELPRPTGEEVWQQLAALLAEELRLDPEGITPATRLADLTGE